MTSLSPFKQVIDESTCDDHGTLEAHIIICTDAQEKALGGDNAHWQVGLMDWGGDFYIMRTYGDEFHGVYKYAWRDKGAREAIFLTNAMNPALVPSVVKQFRIKGAVENHVLDGSCWKSIQKVKLTKCSTGYKLPDNLKLDLVPEQKNEPILVTPLRKRKRAVDTEIDDFDHRVLRYLLEGIAIGSQGSIIESRQNTLHVQAAGAIVETDQHGHSRILCSASGHSTQGGGAVHAEEVMLLEIQKQFNQRKNKRTHASKLGLVVLLIHARGKENEEGSMCSSCVCSLSKFVAKFGIDPEHLVVKYPTRPHMRDPSQFVSSMTALNDVMKDDKSAYEIQFHDCKMNDYQLQHRNANTGVGKTVNALVTENLGERSLDSHNNKTHWHQCSYLPQGPHLFETDHEPVEWRIETVERMVREFATDPEKKQKLQTLLIGNDEIAGEARIQNRDAERTLEPSRDDSSTTEPAAAQARATMKPAVAQEGEDSATKVESKVACIDSKPSALPRGSRMSIGVKLSARRVHEIGATLANAIDESSDDEME